MTEQDPTKPRYYKGWLVDEIIDLFRLNFRLGNAIKYILREGGKDSDGDLRKAIKYLERELYVRHEIQENRGSPLANHVASFIATEPHLADTRQSPEAIAVEINPGLGGLHPRIIAHTGATGSGSPNPDDRSAHGVIAGSDLPIVGWVRVGTSVRVRNHKVNVELGPGDEHYFIAQDLSGGWDASRKATPP